MKDKIRLGKKGVIELQFNWIFVLVVGAVILVFFLSIVYKQKASSEVKLAGSLLSDFEAILSGSKVSTKTSHLLDIPNIDIRFTCADCNCIYKIGDVTKNFRDKYIFAPDSLKGRQMIIYSYDFNVPYRVSNLLYVTSPSVKYVIVYDGDETSRGYALASLLNSSLPDTINKQVVSLSALSSVENLNYFKIRFVFFVTSQNAVLDASFAGADVSAVKIVIPAGISLDAGGKATFYSKLADTFVEGDTIPFFGKASLLAAVFSEDSEIYTCNMEALMERLNHISDVYRQRISDLRAFSQSSGDQNCLIYYNPALIVDVGGFSDDSVLQVSQMYTTLKNNNDLAQLYSCPLLY